MWIWQKLKPIFLRFVPAHINNPLGLIHRMVLSNNSAAWFTLWLTGLAVILTPVDWLMQFWERRTATGTTTGPHIFVCGPARSGTTLVFQVLASTLPLAYPRNFTALFSRAPLLASRLFTRDDSTRRCAGFLNYYGKTSGMQAPSEANHLWNQWVDSDASGFRTRFKPGGVDEMAQFFASLSWQAGRPTLSKNNNANAFASQISQRLDNAYFICLRRDSRYLAQSLVRAREEINGDIAQSYGVIDAENGCHSTDPTTQVIEQITYLNALAKRQQATIGAERFWIVDYEAFCANPSMLVNRIRREVLHYSERDIARQADIPAIANNNRVMDQVEFKKLEKRLRSGMGAQAPLERVRQRGRMARTGQHA